MAVCAQGLCSIPRSSSGMVYVSGITKSELWDHNKEDSLPHQQCSEDRFPWNHGSKSLLILFAVVWDTLILHPVSLQSWAPPTPLPQLCIPPPQPSLTPTKHPPVILLFKITDGDDPGATAHGELVLIGGPAHTAGSSVDPQDDQCRLPRAALQRPHIGIAVCAAGHNAVTLRGPVDACRVGSEDTG